ncbi:putative flap-like endonuclease [Namao virus]|nr:putative flap-like endonuclease [Namao virus]
MGTRNVDKFFKRFCPNKVLPLSLNNNIECKIVIDATSFFFRNTANYKQDLVNSVGKNVSHLYIVINKALPLLSHNIAPLMIFDGPVPAFKVSTNDYFVEKGVIMDCIDLLRMLNIFAYQAKGEAIIDCAKIVKSGVAQFCITDNWSALLMGCPIMIKNATCHLKMAIFIGLDAILNDTGLTLDQLIDVIIMMGSDYCAKIPNIGHVRAMQAIKVYGSLQNYAYARNISYDDTWKHVKDYYSLANIYYIPETLDMYSKKCVRQLFSDTDDEDLNSSQEYMPLDEVTDEFRISRARTSVSQMKVTSQFPEDENSYITKFSSLSVFNIIDDILSCSRGNIRYLLESRFCLHKSLVDTMIRCIKS